MTDKLSIHTRIKIRRCTIQALYQHHITDKEASEILTEFNDKHRFKDAEAAFFKDLVTAIIKLKPELNQQLQRWLDRPLEELDPIALAVLHLGCYELEYWTEVPWKVVINESVELAKLFGSAQSHKYVNSVLDRLAQHSRSAEINNS